MRELSVYYCSKCGRYSYHHLAKKAVCPECSVPMTLLHINYQSFMNMDYSMRDQLIASQIIGDIIPKSSVVQRLSAYSQTCCTRTDAARFRTCLEQLRKDSDFTAEEKNQLGVFLAELVNENLSLKQQLQTQEEACQALSAKNTELEHTVQWMHDLIWNMLSANKKQQEDI